MRLCTVLCVRRARDLSGMRRAPARSKAETRGEGAIVHSPGVSRIIRRRILGQEGEQSLNASPPLVPQCGNGGQNKED